jgi:hypothetical protein
MIGSDDRFTLTIGEVPPSLWEEFAAAYPSVAKYYGEPEKFQKYVDSTVNLIFRQPPAPSGLQKFDQCGEVLISHLSFAIRHTPPALGPGLNGQYFISNGLIRNHKGAFLKVTTPHFRIWADQEILDTDPDVVLEDLYEAYVKDFGQAPLPPVKGAPIDVVFGALGRVRGMTAPDWPILLNEDFWRKFPELRRSLAAHELFHRVQYAFGFRGETAANGKNPNPRSAWFTEGGASWAECIYNSAVTNSQKIQALGVLPRIGLLNGSYYSCPIWLARTGKVKAQAKHEMRKILEAYESGQEPTRATAAFAPDIHARYLAYLKDALGHNGGDSGFHGPFGTSLRSLKLGILPKIIDVTGLNETFETSGTVNRHASEFYRVEGPHNRVVVNATPGVELTFFGITTPQPGPMQAAATAADHRTPFLFAVTGNGNNEPQEFTLALARTAVVPANAPVTPPAISAPITVPEGYTFQMDAFGNVLILGQGCKVALGFQLGPYPSFGGEDPGSPAGNLDWFAPGDPTDPAAGVTVVTRQRFLPSSADASVVRKVTKEAGAQGTELVVETTVTITETTQFASLILSSGENATVEKKLNFDGMDDPVLDPSSNDNDGNSKPLWLAEMTVDGNPLEPEDPIVPYPGRVWVPVPALGPGTHAIMERYRLAAMLQ